MRCVLVGVYFVVAMAVSVSTSLADDAAIARKVAEKLRYQQEQQALKGFHITVKVEEGTVWMLGDVANDGQRDMALDAARRVDGVKLVVNDLDVAAKQAPKAPPAPKVRAENSQFVGDQSSVRQAAAVSRVVAPQRTMVPRVASAPVGAGISRPAMQQQMQRGPVRVAQLGCYGGGGGGGACYGGGGAVETAVDYGGYSSGGYSDGGVVYEGGGGVSSGEVQMPDHAWPSYASYPNYGAVTYPQQYSPKAWPYIGPFYPYPQVPLGWRKVALEWDDGWWMLDFASK